MLGHLFHPPRVLVRDTAPLSIKYRKSTDLNMVGRQNLGAEPGV
jgi:hypothetical protein